MRAAWDPDEDTLLAAIDKLVLVHRLREVVSLLGFTRFEAVSPDKDGELDLDVIRASACRNDHLAARGREPWRRRLHVVSIRRRGEMARAARRPGSWTPASGGVARMGR